MSKVKFHKYLDINEFIEEGFYQEANRLFFHPLGLALEAEYQKDGTFKFFNILDCREDPESITFIELDKPEMQDKVEFVEKLRKKHAKLRNKQYGWEIQPIGHSFRKK